MSPRHDFRMFQAKPVSGSLEQMSLNSTTQNKNSSRTAGTSRLQHGPSICWHAKPHVLHFQKDGCCLQIPNDTIIILLGLVFCCVNPLVCPAALMYFLITWTLEKYNMLYVWRENYQTGGKVSPGLAILQASHCTQGGAGQ